MGGEANLTSTERWGCELKPGIWNWDGVQTEIPQKSNLEGEGESDMGYQYGRAYKYITLGIPLKK